MAKDFAPWSAETAQGIKTDPVDSNIDVKQQVVPALTVGTINAKTVAPLATAKCVVLP